MFGPLGAGQQQRQHRERPSGTAKKTNSNKRCLKAELSLQTCGEMPAAFLTSPCVLPRAPGILAAMGPGAGWLQSSGKSGSGAVSPTQGPAGSSPGMGRGHGAGAGGETRFTQVLVPGHLSSHPALWAGPAFDPAPQHPCLAHLNPGFRRVEGLILKFGFHLGKIIIITCLCDYKEKLENINKPMLSD